MVKSTKHNDRAAVLIVISSQLSFAHFSFSLNFHINTVPITSNIYAMKVGGFSMINIFV